MRDINLIVVHCAATPPTMDIGRAEIDRWHRQRGWLGIGYHLVVRRNGTIEPGRPVEKAGAHVRGHNKNSIGICLVGGVDANNRPESNFTEAQMVALWAILRDLTEAHPGAVVKGHRDLEPKKDCPSFDVVSWWAEAKDKPPAVRTLVCTADNPTGE